MSSWDRWRAAGHWKTIGRFEVRRQPLVEDNCLPGWSASLDQKLLLNCLRVAGPRWEGRRSFHLGESFRIPAIRVGWLSPVFSCRLPLSFGRQTAIGPEVCAPFQSSLPANSSWQIIRFCMSDLVSQWHIGSTDDIYFRTVDRIRFQKSFASQWLASSGTSLEQSFVRITLARSPETLRLIAPRFLVARPTCHVAPRLRSVLNSLIPRPSDITPPREIANFSGHRYRNWSFRTLLLIPTRCTVCRDVSHLLTWIYPSYSTGYRGSNELSVLSLVSLLECTWVSM